MAAWSRALLTSLAMVVVAGCDSARGSVLREDVLPDSGVVTRGLDAEERAALEILRVVDQFESVAVGPGGSFSQNAQALRTLARTEHGAPAILWLLANASAVGRVYALAGLREIAPERYAAEWARLREELGDVHVTSLSGCLVGGARIGDLLDRGFDPRDPELADELLGRERPMRLTPMGPLLEHGRSREGWPRPASERPELPVAISPDGDACYVRPDGAVRCRGWYRPLPPEVRSPAGLVLGSSSAGCLLDGAGQRFCWSEDFDLETRREEPWSLRAYADGPFVALAMEHDRGCGLREGGRVGCFELVRSIDPADGTFDVALPEPARQLSVSGGRACAVGRSGAVRCWSIDDEPEPELVVPASARVLEIAMSEYRLLARMADGTAWEVFSFEEDDPPQRVEPLTAVVEVAAADDHACARASSGVWCWGANQRAQLGLGHRARMEDPVRVPWLDESLRLVAGRRFTCGWFAGERLRCVGESAFFAPSIAERAESRRRAVRLHDETGRPVIASGLSIHEGDAMCLTRAGEIECTAEYVGRRYSSLAMWTACDVVDDRLHCWRPEALAPEATRRVVDGPEDVAAVVGVLPSRSAVLTRAGALWTFRAAEGVRAEGMIVDLTREPIDDAIDLAGSSDELCVLRRSGRVHCWGGQGTDATEHPSTEPIQELPPLASTAAGRDHFCGLTASGEAWCWGDADGFGATPPSVRLEPFDVPLGVASD